MKYWVEGRGVIGVKILTKFTKIYTSEALKNCFNLPPSSNSHSKSTPLINYSLKNVKFRMSLSPLSAWLPHTTRSKIPINSKTSFPSRNFQQTKKNCHKFSLFLRKIWKKSQKKILVECRKKYFNPKSTSEGNLIKIHWWFLQHFFVNWGKLFKWRV